MLFLIKNFPLLMAIFVIGCSIMTISLTLSMPEMIKLPLSILGVILVIWGMFGLILNLWTQKMNNN